MKGNPNLLTTGDIAKACGVAPRTVQKWFDAGRLTGYRILGSGDRRFRIEDVRAFARNSGMPFDETKLSDKARGEDLQETHDAFVERCRELGIDAEAEEMNLLCDWLETH